VGLLDVLPYLAGAGALGSVALLARTPLKAFGDVWLERSKRKSDILRERERRQTELALERERRKTKLAVIRAEALSSVPSIQARAPSRRELPRPP
jgi:hypothetical protein